MKYETFKLRKNKKAISPVVSTILLVLIVVILAIIIFLWARGFIKEKVSKAVSGVEMSAIEACGEINLEASISGSNLDIINKGNVPIHSINFKKIAEGTSEIEEFPAVNIAPGSSWSSTVSTDGYDSFIVIPVILGKTRTAQNAYTCDEEYGIEVS